MELFDKYIYISPFIIGLFVKPVLFMGPLFGLARPVSFVNSQESHYLSGLPGNSKFDKV